MKSAFLPTALCLILTATATLAQEEPRRILFIGNSMIGRTMHHLVKLSEAAGKAVKVVPFTRGGARLEKFTTGDPERDALAKISEGGYSDVVFVQGTSYWFEGPPKDSLNKAMKAEDRLKTAEKTLVAAEKLHERIAGIGARTVLYLGYPHMPAAERDPALFAHLESIHWTMKDRLDAIKISDRTHPTILVPVGVLWMRGAEKFGESTWYMNDRHGSDLAYFANGCLFLACMTDLDPRSTSYTGDLPADQVAWVKEQAWQLSRDYRRPVR